MAIKNKNIDNNAAIARSKLKKDSKFLYTNFKGPAVGTKLGGGAATGTTGDLNILLCDGAMHEYHIKGTQTILVPVTTSVGLDVGMDQTDNDGVEIVFGGEGGASEGWSRLANVVGTDAFYAKLKFKIEDVSGTDDCAFGFRGLEAHQANIDDYDNMAVLNVISGDIKIETIDDDGATTTTDTTLNWADGETHTLEVRVAADRSVSYLIDGAAPTSTAQFSIDNGDTVVPFFFMLNATDVVGKVELIEFECGPLDPNA